MAEIETFQPDKRTLGQLLSNTSPPIRVPEFQRDFSWAEEQVSEFWSDLIAFSRNEPPKELVGKEYFLGAAVLVNNGSFHLLLDGQQRLATTTILLAVLRDKINEFNDKAARQIQDLFITFENYLTGEKVFKIQLNVFDKDFFRDRIQSFPRVEGVQPTKKSHQLIESAYQYLMARVTEGWVSAGDGRKGFEWAGNTAVALCDHLALVTVISNNEKTAGSIFATLNDRGIGLSTVDLIRSSVLQLSHETQREEIIQCWNATLEACGTAIGAETLIRLSWVSVHGDIKARALYREVSELLDGDGVPLSYSRRLRDDAVQYRRFREGDTDDDELQDYWTALRTLNANSGYAPLLAAFHKSAPEDQKFLARALVSLAIRHNIVCDLDRAKFESAVFTAARKISDGGSLEQALEGLRSLSPDEQRFRGSFSQLRFSPQQHAVARYMLQALESKLESTQETAVAGSAKVHVEHIYPQNPPQDRKWSRHGEFVNLLGNLTLLDHRLNVGIKNADFAEKKEQAYRVSRLEITKRLVLYPDDWSPETIAERQSELCNEAEAIWPQLLT
jgi:hypothetical protein